jgi:hypothetical protein
MEKYMDQSILYVDIENLQEIAKQALQVAIGHWPEEFPRPGMLKLYVRADQTELWKIWASHNVHSIEVQVKGVQHYTFNGLKSTADMSLALDALADLLKGRTKHIAVLSDDSDYITLFSAVKENGFSEISEITFKWFMTDRPDTRSQLLIDFFPADYIHTVAYSRVSDIPLADNQKDTLAVDSSTEEERIAKAIIENLPVGLFKSSDCKKIITRFFPEHDLSKSDSAKFGIQFSKDVWPVLERYGVQLPNPNRKPKKYELTEAAKKNLA